GLGIGLTLAKQFVEMHGGTIEARSDGPGRGSEIVVELPRAASFSTEAPVEVPRVAERHHPRWRVLVADDNHDAATSLSTLLGSLGHDTRAAFDGSEALEAVAAFR